MTKVLFVGLGGFVGSVARYLVGLGAARLWPSAGLQIGTLLVNVVGCFLIGILAVFADGRITMSPDLRALLFIGVLGGFTTFSTFAYETLELGRAVTGSIAATNVMLHVIGCLAAVWLGSAAGRALWAPM